MGMRAVGELVQRQAGRLGQRLQHEQLGAADADEPFSQAGRLAERLENPSDGVEHLARTRSRMRCIGSHTS